MFSVTCLSAWQTLSRDLLESLGGFSVSLLAQKKGILDYTLVHPSFFFGPRSIYDILIITVLAKNILGATV